MQGEAQAGEVPNRKGSAGSMKDQALLATGASMPFEDTQVRYCF